MLSLFAGLLSTSIAQAQINPSLAFNQLGTAKNWNEARQMCQGLGSHWDLPMPNQLDSVLQREMASRLYYYIVGNEKRQVDYVLWVRSEREEYNVQLENKSIALKLNPDDGEIGEFDISEKQLHEMQNTYNQLKSLPTDLIRTEAEQEALVKAVSQFKQVYPFAGIEIQLYESYPPNHPLLYSLPEDIFSREIKVSLMKFHPEFIDVRLKNIEIVLQDFSQGLAVVCVSEISQRPLRGGVL